MVAIMELAIMVGIMVAQFCRWPQQGWQQEDWAASPRGQDRRGVAPVTGPAARRPFWATQAGGETTVEASLLAHQSRNYPISQSVFRRR